MKTLIPWLCVVALLGGAAFLYSANRQKEAQLAALRATSEEMEALRAENAELKNAQVSHDEITRLRKDNEDVLRLRNTVRQLSDQLTQLTRQLQSAQTSAQQQQQQIQKLQSETQQARTAAQQTQQAGQALTPEQQASNARYAQMQALQCANNLRQIDGAKQQWALENQKTAESVPTTEQVVAYLKDNVLPACSAGGKYTLNAVGHVPACSIQGHVIPVPQTQ